MANNVKTYELPVMVTSPGTDLDEILDNEELSLSDAFEDLAEIYQAAAEYYVLLADKLKGINAKVDIYCDGPSIEIRGNDESLDELALNGYLQELELEDKVLYEDNTDAVDDDYFDYNERTGDWEYDESPYNFSHEGGE